MESKIVTLYVLTLLHFCILSFDVEESGIIEENISWYEKQLTTYPALRFEIHMTFTFRKELCCPIVHLFSALPDTSEHVKSFYFGIDKCLLNVSTHGRIFWFESTTFILPNNTQDRGNCKLSYGHYKCNISTVILNYEPKLRWLTLGYTCGAQKYLLGLQYKYKINTQNTTQCELMQIPPNLNNFYFQCNQFYHYITFPNLFGHRSQTEAFQTLQAFEIVIRNLDHSCYKHLDYTLCQAFFPRCPEGTNEGNKIVSHLDVICEQMCWDAIGGCFSSLQPVISFIDCNYYNKSSDLNCTYKPVICEPPPAIPNGQITSIISLNKTYNVGSTVKYSCNEDYKLQGNNTSMCQYSANWEPDIICKSTIYITYIIISAICTIGLLLIIVLVGYMYKRYHMKKRRANYFENQPLQKRNREYDAFVSYTYEASIDFVKNPIQRKLELEAKPPFKLLFHTRDFHGATLIFQNILDAVQKSNCAMVLMCQGYIDRPWCREEFQVRKAIYII